MLQRVVVVRGIPKTEKIAMKQIHLRADAIASSSRVDTVERINTADKVVTIFPIVTVNPVVIADGVVTTDPVVRIDAVDSVVAMDPIVTVEGIVTMDELTLCSACMWNRHSKQTDAKVGVAIPVSLAQHAPVVVAKTSRCG